MLNLGYGFLRPIVWQANPVNRPFPRFVGGEIHILIMVVKNRVWMAVLAVPKGLVWAKRYPLDALLIPVNFDEADPFSTPVIILRCVIGVIIAIGSEPVVVPVADRKVTIAVILFGKPDFDRVFTLRINPADIGATIRIFSVVNNVAAISLPHFVARPVFFASAFPLGAQADMRLAIPDPHSANAAVRRPLVVIENNVGIDRGELHMRDPGAFNLFTANEFSGLGIKNIDPRG